MADNLIITSSIENTFLISDSPSFNFAGYLSKNLPSFFAEKIVGTEDYRTLTFLQKEEEILDSLYILIKNLFNEIDLSKSTPKYLYQIGQLLGLVELEDLSFSTDFELIAKQRDYIQNALYRFLMKGTRDSVIQLFHSLGVVLDIEELWTEDFQTYYNYTNRYFKDFTFFERYNNTGTAPERLTKHKGVNTAHYDILTEIDAALSAQSITEILRYEKNNYGFQYALGKISGSLNHLYYKNLNNDWFLFEDSLSGNVIDFRPHEDSIILLENIGATYPQLKIFKYNNFTQTIFTIDNVQYFKIVYIGGESFLLIDKVVSASPLTTHIQLFKLDNYTITSTINKPFTSAVTSIIENKELQWIAFDETNSRVFIIELVNNQLSLPIVTYPGYFNFFRGIPKTYIGSLSTGPFKYNNAGLSATALSGTQTYDGEQFTLSGGKSYITKTLDDNEFLILTLDTSLSGNSKIYKTTITLDDFIIPKYSTGSFTTNLTNLQDLYYLDGDSLLYLSKTGIGVYFISQDVIYREVPDFQDNMTYKKFVPTDSMIKVYLSKEDGSNNYSLELFEDILIYGRIPRFKTHNFNIIVDTSNSLVSFSDSKIETTISSVKPINSSIRNIS